MGTHNRGVVYAGSIKKIENFRPMSRFISSHGNANENSCMIHRMMLFPVILIDYTARPHSKYQCEIFNFVMWWYCVVDHCCHFLR